MKKEKYSIDISFADYEIINPSFAKVLIKIAYAGKNRNKTDIPVQAFEDASPSLPYIPIVGHFVPNCNMFGGHDEEIIMSNDGNMQINDLTKPYGVVANEIIGWKTYKELDGSYRDYYCCYGYLWIERYPELQGIKDHNYGQSMEINVTSSESEGDFIKINSFTYSALAILERDEPCFEGADISSKFSKVNYKKQYEELISSFKKYALDNIEGGNNMEGNKIEEVVSDNTVEYTSEENETQDNACKPKKKNSTEVNAKKQDGELKENKKKCSEENEEEKVDYSTIVSNLRSELQEFKNNYSELEVKYNVLMEDLAKLNDENAKYKLAEREENIKTIFSEYDEELIGFESYDNLKSNNNEYSLDELKNECLLVYGKFMKDKNSNKKKLNKKEEIKQFNLDTIESKTDFSIWNGLKDIK